MLFGPGVVVVDLVRLDDDDDGYARDVGQVLAGWLIDEAWELLAETGHIDPVLGDVVTPSTS